MTVVVVTPRDELAEAIIGQLLPHPMGIVRAQRCYRFFDVTGGVPEAFAFRDVDGEVLTEYRTFQTLDAAKSWVAEDAKQAEHRVEQAR